MQKLNGATKFLNMIHQGDYTLEGKKAPYLTQTENQIQDPTYQTKDIESNILSEASKIDFKGLSDNKQGNIPSNQEKRNFITSEDNFVGDVWQSPGKISEEDKILDELLR